MILKFDVKHSFHLFLIYFNIWSFAQAVAWKEGFICLWYRSLFIVCSLAVTYKRIVPRQRILNGVESSYEPNRGNISRKRKKPGAGTYKENFYATCMFTTLFARMPWLKTLPHFSLWQISFLKIICYLMTKQDKYIFIRQEKICRKQN